MKIPSEYHVLLPISRGSNGQDVKLVQEWLCLHDCRVKIDGDFGPATEAAVKKFQTKVKLQQTNIVDELVFRALIAPITRACRQLDTTAEAFSQRVVAAARQHLKEQPKEVGGQGSGPWVRLYSGGKEGRDVVWCAGFVTTLITQSQEGLRTPANVVKGSLSCDALVKQAQELDLFATERLVEEGIVKRSDLGSGTVFLIRAEHEPTHWIHAGIVTAFHPDYMETIEGNVNDEENRYGSEVCRMLRGYRNIDFIKL